MLRQKSQEVNSIPRDAKEVNAMPKKPLIYEKSPRQKIHK